MATRVRIPSDSSTNISLQSVARQKVAVQAARGNLGPTGPEGPFGPKSITIQYPTAQEDITLLYTQDALTLERISMGLTANSTSNVAYTLRYSGDRANTGTEIVTGGSIAYSGNNVNIVSSFNNGVIPSNNYIWFETSSINGSVQEIHITLDFG